MEGTEGDGINRGQKEEGSSRSAGGSPASGSLSEGGWSQRPLRGSRRTPSAGREQNSLPSWPARVGWERKNRPLLRQVRPQRSQDLRRPRVSPLAPRRPARRRDQIPFMIRRQQPSASSPSPRDRAPIVDPSIARQLSCPRVPRMGEPPVPASHRSIHDSPPVVGTNGAACPRRPASTKRPTNAEKGRMSCPTLADSNADK